MDKYGHEKLTVRDFLRLVAPTGLVVTAISAPSLTIAYQYLDSRWNSYRKADIARFSKRFYKQKLLRSSEKGGETTLILSENGQKKTLRYNFDELALKKKASSKITVICFDIPEQKKLAREMLRKKLKELGFVQIQKSIYASAYDCGDEIEFIVNFLQIDQYVLTFQIDKKALEPTFSVTKFANV